TPHRIPPREQPPVRGHAGPRLPRLHRRPAGARGPAAPPGDGRGRDGDRHRNRLLPPDRRAVEGVPATSRPGAGDPASPRPPRARRADRGARPEPARRDPPSDRGAREGPYRHPLDPRASRSAADVLPAPDHQSGEDRGRRTGGPADRPGGGGRGGRHCRRSSGVGCRGGARAAAGRSPGDPGAGRGRRARRRHAHRGRLARPATRDLRARALPRLDAVRAAPAGRHPRGPVPAAHAEGSLTMRATWTIARREVKALFDQPTAYILLVVFTAVNGFLCFRQVDLYGVASLRPMFDFLPWLLLFLVPAVTMLAVTVTFALILVGLDPLIVGLPPQLGAIAASLGVLSHFSGLGRGVIDLRDAVYFVTLAALFLIFAYVALLSRKLTPQGEALKRLRLGTVLLATTMLVV